MGLVLGLSGTGKLQVSVDEWRNGETVRDRLRASQAILVETPSSFRLEALSPFGVTYAVASDGREIAILIPSERALYRGQATAPTIGMATGVAASATEVTAVLLGLLLARLIERLRHHPLVPRGDPPAKEFLSMQEQRFPKLDIEN
jgi:hypothetical protein